MPNLTGRLALIAVAVVFAAAARAQINLSVDDSLLADAAFYQEFTVNFGAAPTTTTITADVTYTPAVIPADVSVRLIDIDNLIDDPGGFSGGDYIATDTASGAATLTVSLTPPNSTGEKHFMLEIETTDGSAWEFEADITAPALSGELADTGTLVHETDTIVSVGSFVRGRVDFDDDIDVVTMRFSVDLGAALTSLTYVTSLSGTSIDNIQFFAPPGVENQSIETVEDAFTLAFADDGSELIDQLDVGGSIDESRFYESDNNLSGEVEVTVKAFTEPGEDGNIDFIMLFAGDQDIVETDELAESNTNSIPIGDSLASACALTGKGNASGLVTALVAMLGVWFLCLRLRSR